MHNRWIFHSLFIIGLVPVGMCAQPQEKIRPDTSQIPMVIMETLKAKFPHFEVEKWSREKEGDVIVYDIEFMQKGDKYEADVKEDGTIDNWEQAIAIVDLPTVVRKAVEKKYPKSRMVEVMRITAVKAGKDVLEGYEIVLKTRDKKDVEMTVAPDGKILEDSGGEKAN